MLERMLRFARQHDLPDARIVDNENGPIVRVAVSVSFRESDARGECSELVYCRTPRELRDALGY